MSSVSIRMDIVVNIETTETEKRELVRAYRILRGILNDLYAADVEGTEVGVECGVAEEYLGVFMEKYLGITDFEEPEEI